MISTKQPFDNRRRQLNQKEQRDANERQEQERFRILIQVKLKREVANRIMQQQEERLRLQIRDQVMKQKYQQIVREEQKNINKQIREKILMEKGKIIFQQCYAEYKKEAFDKMNNQSFNQYLKKKKLGQSCQDLSTQYINYSRIRNNNYKKEKQKQDLEQLKIKVNQSSFEVQIRNQAQSSYQKLKTHRKNPIFQTPEKTDMNKNIATKSFQKFIDSSHLFCESKSLKKQQKVEGKQIPWKPMGNIALFSEKCMSSTKFERSTFTSANKNTKPRSSSKPKNSK